MIFDLSADSKCNAYDLLTQTVVPRPIAWILTENADGGLNLAPFSYFNVVASRPVLFSVSMGLRPDKSPKDTRRNLVAGRPCVIHIPTAGQIDAVNQSAASLPPGVSELADCSLETVPFGNFPLPRLAEAPVAYGGKLRREVSFPGVPQGLMIIEAECAYVDERAVVADREAHPPQFDPTRLSPLMKLGRTEYGKLGEVMSRPRPV